MAQWHSAIWIEESPSSPSLFGTFLVFRMDVLSITQLWSPSSLSYSTIHHSVFCLTWLFSLSCVGEVTKYVFFCDWLMQLSLMSSRFSLVVAHMRIFSPLLRLFHYNCRGPVSTKIPLARVEVWGFQNIVENMKMWMKTEKHRIVSEGSFSENWNSSAFNFQLLKNNPWSQKVEVRQKLHWHNTWK